MRRRDDHQEYDYQHQRTAYNRDAAAYRCRCKQEFRGAVRPTECAHGSLNMGNFAGEIKKPWTVPGSGMQSKHLLRRSECYNMLGADHSAQSPAPLNEGRNSIKAGDLACSKAAYSCVWGSARLENTQKRIFPLASPFMPCHPGRRAP
jgi:hypothetical protein